MNSTYHVHLASVLLLSDLGGALLVRVCAHNLMLQSLELVGGGADALDVLSLAFVADLEQGHLPGQVVLKRCGVRSCRHHTLTYFFLILITTPFITHDYWPQSDLTEKRKATCED